MTATTATTYAEGRMTSEQRMVIFASSLGTVFEWYDFYIYGTLGVFLAKYFFSNVPANVGFIFALLAFAAGFAVRPFGALIFGRIGDMVGRKYTFLITIVIMGLSTFLVGCLPTYGTIGIAAPIALIALRLLQGLALGGEYGGAATYVAEHAPNGKRGLYTSWIQTTATLGFFLSLIVLLASALLLGERIGALRWAMVVLGFIGALLVMQPSLAGISRGNVFALLSGAGYAFGMMVTRRLAPHDPGLVTGLISALTGVVLYSFAMPWVWLPPSGTEWLWLAAVGCSLRWNRLT